MPSQKQVCQNNLNGTNLTERFQATDGFSIAYRHWKAAEPKRVILCIHGIGDYSGWFRNIAPTLAEKGNEVYALDLRGFGESQQEELPRGFVRDFKRHLKDIDDFATHVKCHNKGKKLFVLGHSLGGIYGIWYAANYPQSIDGLVLAAPAVISAFSAPTNGIKVLFGNIFTPKKIHDPYSSPDAKDRDPEEITIMLDDPLETWKFPVSYISNVKLVLLKNIWRNASLIRAPVLILQGEVDVTVHPSGARQLYDKLQSSDKKLRFFADAGHWFYDALSPATPRGKYDPVKRGQVAAAINEWLAAK